ncbi:DUF2502 domain-containing protein [Ewingella americana]|uniref:DUF2502 domain-containing protein n=1 Tax=Ewingella americana TaxID=41202 RepID=A0A502GN67_9GAMM|nr:DUF2502 domain-containing protein [Ewingella americana]TPG63314.1 DUF2502 domain-containing protein [Ewingella americana]
MLKPFIIGTLLFALLPAAAPAVQASSFSLNTPGLSINIGDRDRRGYYWDGYDWRDAGWWNNHRGRNYGERSHRGYYWDGGRWRDRGWWDGRSRHRPPPRYYGRPYDDHGHRGHRDDRGRGPDRGHGGRDGHDGHGDHRR